MPLARAPVDGVSQGHRPSVALSCPSPNTKECFSPAPHGGETCSLCSYDLLFPYGIAPLLLMILRLAASIESNTGFQSVVRLRVRARLTRSGDDTADHDQAVQVKPVLIGQIFSPKS